MTEPQSTEPASGAPEASSSQPDARISELEAALGEARAEQLRLLAEMENQRKRWQREAEAARKFGAERLLGDLLPVLDSLEAGLKVADAEAVTLREGMQMTLRLLEKVLATGGATPVDPVGAVFNPEWHQAMSLVDAPNQAPGSVVNVLQKGWRLHERLLRPAMVAVAREPQ